MKRDQEGRQPQDWEQYSNRWKNSTGKRITVDDIEDALNISHGSAYSILHDTLNWLGAKLVEDATKELFFMTEFKS
jgi:hypothetical protein